MIEVDQDVAAQDNIEFIEGTICCQIMLEKTMFSLEGRVKKWRCRML